jgi:hypothetical protein
VKWQEQGQLDGQMLLPVMGLGCCMLELTQGGRVLVPDWGLE